MDYDWMDAYLLSKKGAEKDFKVEWDATRYMVGGKMFAMQGGDKEHKPIITLKCEPPFGQMLRQQYPDIVAGYYMNKEHWNSVYLDGDVPNETVQKMIDESYLLIFSGLTKKMQKDILEK